MQMNKTLIFVFIGALVAGVVAAWAFFPGVVVTLPIIGGTEATSTATSTATEPPEEGDPNFAELPEPNIPPGATVIDQYFYTLNGEVFLNSVVTSTSTPLPTLRGESFRRLTEFQSAGLPLPARCVAPGNYAFYTDARQVFLYQIWLNSEFKRSKFDVVPTTKPDQFALLTPSSFRGGKGTYQIGLELATTTCNYNFTLSS